MSELQAYIAHIRKSDGKEQLLSEHLLQTAGMCAIFADKIGLSKTGYVLGLLHDFGKYSKAFQTYLRSVAGDPDADQDNDDIPVPQMRRGDVDHSTAGARVLWDRFPQEGKNWPLYAQVLALAITAHHSGLINCLAPDGEKIFNKRMKKDEAKTFRSACEKSADVKILQELQKINVSLNLELRTMCDSIANREKIKEASANTDIQVYDQRNAAPFKRGLLVRFLLSCLLDADRINSAEFEDPDYAELRKQLSRKTDWKLLRERLESELRSLPTTGGINGIRQDISDCCAARAQAAKGLFTLTVPTGGGKTLASLRFALAHAHKHNLDRIVYVVPYTSIIDQNAQIARRILEQSGAPGSIVLEHHSNLQPENQSWQSRLLAQNWESPVVFTTMVQFLETLFSSGTRGARHMHALANAVLIFDEIQTLPVRCVHIFCNALNFLIETCGASSVLCTATQPLLGALPHPFKGQLDLTSEKEIMPNISDMFLNLRRVKFINHCRKPMERKEIAALALKELGLAGSCLVVVNTKKWADILYKLCKEQTDACVIYLSTLLCPEHRLTLLEQIQWLLKEKCPVLCVSTQLIECGVDISFGAVIRFAAGLDSILQAAGRCNRHSEREKGRVHIVTVPQDQEALTSLVDIKRGKEVLLRMTYEDGCPMCEPEADLTDPALIRNYFEYYFFQQKDEMTYPLAKSDSLLRLLGKNDKNPGFDDRFSMLQQSFREAGCRFHPIDSPTQGVLVPYGRGKALIAELCSASGQYAKRDLLREAQQYTVNIYPNLMRQLDEAGALHCIKELDILTLGSGYYDESLGVVAENMGYMDTHNL